MTKIIDPREQQLKILHRLIAAKEAKDSLLRYIQLTMPDREDPEDAQKTFYKITPQAKLLCEVMQMIEQGKLLRVAVSIGPQMGKSEIISRRGPAWMQGRNPYRNLILGSYNQDFANDFGFDVRTIVNSPAHKQVFPEFELMRGGESKSELVTKQGGKLAFVGVGGSGTGKPADGFIVEDPYRGPEDADSQAYRDKVWNWFNGVARSRARNKTWILIVHTRWHQDDLIGRLCDPAHPERNGLYKGVADRWVYINLPAVIEDEDLAKALGLTLETQTDPFVIEQFGDKPMVPLWADEKSLSLLAEHKQADPKGFNALYMGAASPEEGDYFKKDYLVEYDSHELPKNLRIYGASDHAVSKKKRADFSVLGCVGIDENDEIWVLPDLVWRRMQSDVTVEELLTQFRVHKPALWWLEDENIAKAFGPFLIKRMQEEKVYTVLDPIIPSADLETRARSIQGRMAMKMIHFPRFAPWWQKARQEILTFPSAAHDDFVAFLALVGLGLTKEYRPSAPRKEKKSYQVGSMPWILNAAAARAKKDKRKSARAGW